MGCCGSTATAPEPPTPAHQVTSAMPAPLKLTDSIGPSGIKACSPPAPEKSKPPDSRSPMPNHSKSGSRAIAMSELNRRSLTSTVKQVLTDHQKILVVGKRGSGKSSLIKAVFKVDMSTAQARAPDVNYAFRPDDNHHLIVHECPGLEPGDAQGFRAIRDFISARTDPNQPAPERLHAIWICIPTSDAQNGSIGEGVEEIVNMRRVPVVVAFTKSDASFPEITGSESGSYAQCNQLCRPLFRREPRDVPAELVSVAPQFGGLINNLIMTTNRFIMCPGSVSTSARSSPLGAKPPITPGPLAWSVALRASRDISIQASIEIGRIRYWRNLWSIVDFADQPLRSCVNIIHNDIVEIWNLYDKSRYLSSDRFKMNMSHVVKDLAMQAVNPLRSPDWNVSGEDFADWVHEKYQWSRENIQCVMGYIVNLTVILDEIFRTATGNVSVMENAVLRVMVTHIKSDRRDGIHRDIRSFVSQASVNWAAAPPNDLVVEKVADLIR